MSWTALADVVAIIHACYVAFVLLGFAAIFAGARWARNFVFRLAHLVAMALVCLEQLTGIECPLTRIENALRLRAGEPSYAADFIGYWLDRLIFYDAPAWIFVLLYFGCIALVVVSWWRWPPRLAGAAGRKARTLIQCGDAELARSGSAGSSKPLVVHRTRRSSEEQ
jgi:hypothetical protein